MSTHIAGFLWESKQNLAIIISKYAPVCFTVYANLHKLHSCQIYASFTTNTKLCGFMCLYVSKSAEEIRCIFDDI